MNNIKRCVNDYYQLRQRCTGEHIDFLKVNEEILMLTDIAKRELNVMELMNRREVECNYIDLSEISFTEDSYYYSISGIAMYDNKAFYSQEQYEDYVQEQIDTYDLDDSDFPHFDEIFYEDEVYINSAWIYYDDEIDFDVANEAKLTVIEVNRPNIEEYNKRYLTLSGCGMDLSFSYNYYIGVVYGGVSESFRERDLLWMFQNMNRDKCLKFLVSVGVDKNIANLYLDKHYKE